MLKRIGFLYSWLKLRSSVRISSGAYGQYLEEQLSRTLAKKHTVEGVRTHTKILVDKLSQFANLSDCDVLCIGCRDHYELDYFISKGVQKICGIDLQSSSSDIVIMDMHNMLFPDKSFDVIYSSHSLEHAYDHQKVANEILRVARQEAFIAIEVPVQYDVRGADLIDFENAGNILKLFGTHVTKILLSEVLPANHPGNDMGTAIARVLFQIDKDSEDAVKTIKP